MRRNYRLVTVLAVALALLTATGLALPSTAPVWAQVPVTRMRNVAIQVLSVTSGLTADDINVTDDLAVTDDISADVVAAADLTASDDLTVSDDATITDKLSVDKLLFVPPAATGVITVTYDSVITPTGTYQGIRSAGTVGTASIAAGSAGDLLILHNTVNQTIVLTDTGTLKLSGNISLGQYDTLTLISDGTNWIQLATSNN